MSVSLLRRPVALDALTASVIAGTSALTAAVYRRLPDPKPTHYDALGRPNGWMPRPAGAWVIVATTVAIVLVFRAAGVVLPRGWRERFAASPVRAVTLSLVVFLCGVQLLMLKAGLSPSPRLGGTVWLLVGALLVALGLALPRTRRNPLIGVRTPFTLSSDENWARTHRVAGYWMTLGGCAVMVAGILGRPRLALAGILVSATAPVLWSWILARGGPGDVPPLSGGPHGT
jgi:uncharacterized membrane protein